MNLEELKKILIKHLDYDSQAISLYLPNLERDINDLKAYLNTTDERFERTNIVLKLYCNIRYNLGLTTMDSNTVIAAMEKLKEAIINDILDNEMKKSSINNDFHKHIDDIPLFLINLIFMDIDLELVTDVFNRLLESSAILSEDTPRLSKGNMDLTQFYVYEKRLWQLIQDKDQDNFIREFKAYIDVYLNLEPVRLTMEVAGLDFITIQRKLYQIGYLNVKRFKENRSR